MSDGEMRRLPVGDDQAVRSAKAAQLAARFAMANGNVIALVERLSDDEWARPCEGGARTVGQVVGHIAAGHLIIGGIAQAIALGLPLPVAARRTKMTGAAYNARQADHFATLTRQGALRALRRNGGICARFIAGLCDAELDRTVPDIGVMVSARQEIEQALLGHMAHHLAGIREAVSSPGPTQPGGG